MKDRYIYNPENQGNMKPESMEVFSKAKAAMVRRQRFILIVLLAVTLACIFAALYWNELQRLRFG